MRFTRFIYLFFILFPCFFVINSFGQDHKIDSLTNLLQNTKQDTTRLQLYLMLGEACDVKDNLKYAQPALQLADKLLTQVINEKERKSILKQKANAYQLISIFYESSNNISKTLDYKQKELSIFRDIKDSVNVVRLILGLGFYYNEIGNFPMALEYYQKGLSISKTMNYKKGIAGALFNIGRMYNAQGDTSQALSNYQKSLSTFYELRDTFQIAEVLVRMGDFYGRRNVSKALECYNRAIGFYQKTKVQRGVRWVYSQIGGMYQDNNDLTNALINFEKALLVAQEVNDKYLAGLILNDIGNIYTHQGDNTNAFNYYNRALNIAEEFKDPYSIARSYSSLANMYLQQKNYTKAKVYSDRSLAMAKEQTQIKIILNAELMAARIDSANGNGNGAYEHYKQYIILRDKLKDKEVLKAATKEKFQAEYEKQKIEEKAQQEKKDIVLKDEIRQQKLLRNSLIVGFALLLIITFIVLKSYRQKQKTNKELAEKNTEIEEKNKDIMDSIRYAKRIQTSLLPTEKFIERVLNDKSKKKR